MKIYVSGTFTRQAQLRPIADKLRQFGHELTSTWLYEAKRPAHFNTAVHNLALADKDVAEVFAADCIILDLDGDSTTGGRYTEWGVTCHPTSLQLRYVVGGKGKDGVFLAKAHRRFETWDELFAYFEVNHNAIHQE
jgi:hypothetical protein